MNKLKPHAIERSVIEQKTEISQDFLSDARDMLDERPDLLPTVFRREIQLAAGLIALGGEGAAAAVQRAARASALMFVHAAHPNESTFITLDDSTPVELAGDLDGTLVNAPAFVEGLWCALAVDDALAGAWLAAVPSSLLAAQGSQHGQYAFALVGLLRSLVTGDGCHGHWLAEAIEQCDDDTDGPLAQTRDWVDGIELPAMRAAFHVLAGDAPGFSGALATLHEQHRAYWNTAENRLAVDGLLSLRGCALRRLAAKLGLAVEVDTDYVPAGIWQAPSPRPQQHCPYCTSPLSSGAPACGLCGRDIRDAPLELPEPKADQNTPCSGCGFPLHLLAVSCPRCRAARSK